MRLCIEAVQLSWLVLSMHYLCCFFAGHSVPFSIDFVRLKSYEVQCVYKILWITVSATNVIHTHKLYSSTLSHWNANSEGMHSTLMSNTASHTTIVLQPFSPLMQGLAGGFTQQFYAITQQFHNSKPWYTQFITKRFYSSKESLWVGKG